MSAKNKGSKAASVAKGVVGTAIATTAALTSPQNTVEKFAKYDQDRRSNNSQLEAQKSSNANANKSTWTSGKK